MPSYDDPSEPKTGTPQNWADATRMLKKSIASGVDADVFADPLAPQKQEPLKYLGHFANDDVMNAGHNIGAKQIGAKEAGSGKVAKQGYRCIPGNAKDGYIAKKVRQSMETATATINRYGGPIPAHGYGPPMSSPDKAPLRERDRMAKAAAKKAQGELHFTKKKR